MGCRDTGRLLSPQASALGALHDALRESAAPPRPGESTRLRTRDGRAFTVHMLTPTSGGTLWGGVASGDVVAFTPGVYTEASVGLPLGAVMRFDQVVHLVGLGDAPTDVVLRFAGMENRNRN